MLSDGDVRRRIRMSAAFAAVMGLITTMAAWVGAGVGYTMHGPPQVTEYRMRLVSAAIEAYRAESHALPDDLIVLYGWTIETPSHQNGLRVFERGSPGIVLDGWRHPMLYAHQRGLFTITSLGSDGQPDGVGIAKDLIFDGSLGALREPPGTMTLVQYLRQPRAPSMLLWCAICAVVSGLLCFALSPQKRYQQPPAVPPYFYGLVTAAAATFFTYIMSLLEIVKYH